MLQGNKIRNKISPGKGIRMGKWVAGFMLGLLFMMSSGVAFASLQDNRAAVAAQYGDYHFVIDTDNQLWTKADWDAKGYKSAKPSTYVYFTERQGLRFEVDVAYDGNKPDSLVKVERFTPDMPIHIKDFKSYFPELYPLLTAKHAIPFGTYDAPSQYFQDPESPAFLGVVDKDFLVKDSYYTLFAFNIENEGRLVKSIDEIDGNTYIREFTIERASRTDLTENMDTANPSWRTIQNYF
jgi:hypothetical protein